MDSRPRAYRTHIRYKYRILFVLALTVGKVALWVLVKTCGQMYTSTIVRSSTLLITSCAKLTCDGSLRNFITPEADLYIDVFDKSRGDQMAPHGREGLYFAESGEHVLYSVCKRVSEVLFSLGKSQSPEPTTFSREECLKYFGDGVSASNIYG